MNVSMYSQLLPLLVVISLVYSATRYDDWPDILVEAFRWGSRMLGFMVCIMLVMLVLAFFARR
jgi:hypothetical protein